MKIRYLTKQPYKLIQLDLLTLLLEEVNRQLLSNNLKVSECEGAFVDATLITSVSRPRRHIENTQEAVQPNPEYAEGISVIESSDPDARWVKKGKFGYFGYKLFARTNREGLLEHLHVTSANVAEINQFEHVLLNSAAQLVIADKGYGSQHNRDYLSSHGIKDGLMHKAYRNRPLTAEQKQHNKTLSKVRFVVERTFGTLKRQFRFDRASYMTKEKVLSQAIIKALCYNLLRGITQVKYA